MTLHDLKNLRIAILGLGREGSSILNFLKDKGITPEIALDRCKPHEEIERTFLDKGVRVRYGDDYLDDLDGYDLIFRSPGIPRLHPKLLAVKDQAKISSSTRLFFDLCPCRIIGVTGTKGKTTTSTLIYEIIRSSGRHVLLGGNVGEPALNLLEGLDGESLAVLEMSSFQLQDMTVSPHIAVLLNVTHDHIDLHHSFKAASHDSYEEYVAAKQQIIAHQKPEDFAVLSEALPATYQKIGAGRKIIARQSDAKAFSTKLIGEHNLANIAAAAAVAAILEIPESMVKDAIGNFEPVQHRLKIVSAARGVTYVDDSASTDIDSSMAAIDAFPGRIIIILGGSDKNLDYGPLGKKIVSENKVKGVIAVGQVGPLIIDSLKGYQGKILTGAKSMREIVDQANSLAESGDIVLLSPAAASFDMFKDAKDRGDQFIKLVR
ncbi:MAG: UDP-N-acetylmuramoyl-L-alanine--D-glutamate ligase [Candidatus Saccharibacteria bacterium]